MTGSQVNPANSVPYEPLLHDEDCHKATKTTEIPFAELWESPNDSCSEDGLGHLVVFRTGLTPFHGAQSFSFIWIVGFAPQALCWRPRRGFYDVCENCVELTQAFR